MPRRKVAVVVSIGGLTLVGCVLVALHLTQGKEEQPVLNEHDYVKTNTVQRSDGYNQLVRSEILQGNIGRIDTIGIRNSLPSECNDATPLLEVRTFAREPDGAARPFYVSVLLIASRSPLSSCAHGVGGYGLRLGLADKTDKAYQLDNLLNLLWDTEYTARGIYHRPGDPNNTSVGQTPEVRFRTPPKLAPGEIYRVDLILIDRMSAGNSST